MKIDALLSDLQKYTHWGEEVHDGMAIVNWDKKYFIDSIDILRFLESRNLIPGFSSPPYVHEQCQDYPLIWNQRNELISALSEAIGNPGYNSGSWAMIYPTMISDFKKILIDLEKIKEDGIQFQLENRNVSHLAETGTEYVSDISGGLVWSILNFFCRSDMKNKCYFLEFSSISGDGYQINTKEQDCQIMHIVVSIGQEFDAEDENKLHELFAEVRTLVGLTPEFEDWEFPIPPTWQINNALFLRNTTIDERTLGRRLCPDWEWY